VYTEYLYNEHTHTIILYCYVYIYNRIYNVLYVQRVLLMGNRLPRARTEASTPQPGAEECRSETNPPQARVYTITVVHSRNHVAVVDRISWYFILLSSIFILLLLLLLLLISIIWDVITTITSCRGDPYKICTRRDRYIWWCKYFKIVRRKFVSRCIWNMGATKKLVLAICTR